MSLPLMHSKRHSLQDISPCYEPGAALPILPIILAQTEIGKTFSPGKLLAQEEIGKRHWTSPHESGLAGIRSKARGSDVRFTPYTMAVPELHGSHNSSTGDSESSTVERPQHVDDALQTPGYLASDSASRMPLIPKPVGEAGRPGRGGYTFSKHVKLKKTDLARIKEFINDIVQKQLDTSKCFASQSPKLINIVEKLVAERFPVMHTYENLWPVTDLIRLRLKYTSSESRKAQDKADAKLGKVLRSDK
ncbi:hypothetical protein HYPSUDRAFT_55087 [Hypholoma sublateritium FD-334 SS-4]|uniref:Uncharacterized protein n=1 Tax=Hypholoma sublateritium (strain FD-334 SS-4) TaxID=945553 RepID=A0A0D2L5U1_HYPSF|nr:hypothetical protein HYPSUDRAFT_55087 [Hypholoma sublateritium FD-334 SS-4]